MRPAADLSRGRRIAGWVLGGLPAAMLLAGAVSNLLRLPGVVEGAVKMGYRERDLPGIGATLLVSVLLYLIPRTSPVGAVLLTAYLGGAVATHVIAGDPMGTRLIPVFFAVPLWLGLYLRDPRLRHLLSPPR